MLTFLISLLLSLAQGVSAGPPLLELEALCAPDANHYAVVVTAPVAGQIRLGYKSLFENDFAVYEVERGRTRLVVPHSQFGDFTLYARYADRPSELSAVNVETARCTNALPDTSTAG